VTELSSVQQWSYPFNLKGEEGQSSKPVTDPLQYFDALAKAKGGYYPIGKNGLWHGGVHFDSGTAASLDQSAIRCIADGEVVAYRVDDTYKKSNFSSGEKLFSTGFVLVRHKLELPKLNEQANATNTPTEQPSLIFYSLYMHLLDWAGYTKENAPTPPNFLNKAVYSVKADKATDVVKGLRVRTAPRNGQIKAVLPKGTRVKLGEQSATNNKWYRLISILEGQALPAINLDEECWVFEGQLDHTDVSDERLVGVKANDTEPTLAPQKGLNIRKAATGADKKLLTGLIPVDVTFTLETDTGRYCKIKEFISGQNILPLKEDCIKNISGYVYKECLQASRIPPTLNDIHVLDSPHPIRAGEIIGHLGIYQNHDDIAAEPMLHLEVFSCEDVPAFIEKTKAAAASLPDDKKNLLKIHKEASKLISHRSDISASNPPKLSDTGTVIGVDMIFNLEVLNNYPQDRKITVTETSPGSKTSKTRTWWRLDNILADQQGNKISGWLTEQSELTTRHSPWEWEGFDFIRETPSNLDHLASHLTNTNQIDEIEQASYSANIKYSESGPIKERLYKILDLNNDKAFTPTETKLALKEAWLSQSIYKLITKYESEWFWKKNKWEEIDSIMLLGEENSDWSTEKERIEQLSWWHQVNSIQNKENDLTTIHNLENPVTWHISIAGLIDNFNTFESNAITLEMLAAVNPSGTEIHHKNILPILNKYTKAYKLKNKRELAHFLSQIAHESNLNAVEEGLYYSPMQMRATFGCKAKNRKSGYNSLTDSCNFGVLREKLWTNESHYARNAENLGNYVYANRLGNGSEESGDGYKYRGRGMIQTTGKDAYRYFQNVHNRQNPDDIRDFISHPELLSTSLDYSVESAFVFWFSKQTANGLKLSDIAKTEGVVRVTEIVNGGQNGLTDRKNKYNAIAPLLNLEQEI